MTVRRVIARSSRLRLIQSEGRWCSTVRTGSTELAPVQRSSCHFSAFHGRPRETTTCCRTRTVEPKRVIAWTGFALWQPTDWGVPAVEIDMTNAEAFMIQEGSYIDASRDEVISRFGSFDRYADEALHLDASVVEHLRDTLLI